MSAAEMSAVATAPAVRRPPVVSTRFLRSELGMVFGRRRNLAILAVLAGIPIVIAIAIKVTAPVNDGRDGPPFLFSITANGIFVALTALTVVLPLFLPLAVAVVAGEAVAGEASLGTLRYLLVVPVSRTRLLAVKYAGGLAYCLAAAFIVGVVGALMGALLFPVGPVTLLSGPQVSYGAGLARLLLVALYIAAMMAGLAAIGLFVSALTESAIAAMATTPVQAALSQVLNHVPRVVWMAPRSFSHDWADYADRRSNPCTT